MGAYLLILILLVLGIFAFDIKGQKKKGKEYYVLCIFFMWLISILSYKIGIDTYSYLINFNKMPYWSNFSFSELNDYYLEPIWVILNISIKSIFDDFIFLRIFCITLLDLSIGFLIYKLSRYPFSVLLLLYLVLWIHLNFEILRQSCAMTFYFWGCLALFKSNDRKTFLLRALPMILFHKTGIAIYILTFIFSYIIITKKWIISSYILFIISVSSTFIFSNALTLINIYSSDYGELYTQYMENQKEGINIVKNLYGMIFPFILNILIPSLLSYYYSKKSQYWLSRLIFLYLLLGVFQFSFVIFKRLMQYEQIFYLIGIINLLMGQVTRFKCSKLGIITFIGVIMMIYVPISGYISKDKNEFVINGMDIRYFPYTSIFTSQYELIQRNRILQNQPRRELKKPSNDN
ncbi:MAG: EpsG family protein [Bacteroidales bacterium]|nr:EpsG family protein [Bacteroidales bacterium]